MSRRWLPGFIRMCDPGKSGQSPASNPYLSGCEIRRNPDLAAVACCLLATKSGFLRLSHPDQSGSNPDFAVCNIRINPDFTCRQIRIPHSDKRVYFSKVPAISSHRNSKKWIVFSFEKPSPRSVRAVFFKRCYFSFLFLSFPFFFASPYFPACTSSETNSKARLARAKIVECRKLRDFVLINCIARNLLTQDSV